MLFKNEKVKLLICGHDLKFLRSFIDHMEGSESFDVHVLNHSGHHLDSISEARKWLEWADVIFCEWALGNAVWFSQHKKPGQVLIIRLHAQEVRARDRISFIWEIDWEKVDRLVLITDHLYEWMINEFPQLKSKACLVYNAVNIHENDDYIEEEDRRFTLGFVGLVPSLKRIDLAVALIMLLKSRDSRFTLRIKGKGPEEFPWMQSRVTEMEWYRNIYRHIDALNSEFPGSIQFDPFDPEMNAWYSKIGFILSLSDSEGSHQAVAEGMAQGCIPAMRNWVGASQIYPPMFVSTTLESIANGVFQRSHSDNFRETSAYCLSFSRMNFQSSAIHGKLEGLIHDCLQMKESSVNGSVYFGSGETLPRIMIVAYLPINSGGGYRIRIEQEIKQFIRNGCQVTLTALMPSAQFGEDHEEYRRNHKKVMESLGCYVYQVPIDDFFGANITETKFESSLRMVEDAIKERKVHVVHGEALYCGRFVAFLKKRNPKSVVSVDWHGVAPEEEKMSGAHENRIVAVERVEKDTLEAVDLNVFVSNAMREHYSEKYGSVGKSHVIVPCCVSNERFITKGSRGSGFIWGEEIHNPFVLTYAGTMAAWQCGEEMIKLFSQLYALQSRVRLSLLIPESDQPIVKKHLSSLNVPEHAFKMKSVPHSAVPFNLQSASAGLLLRKKDPVNKVSSPTKFGEYLAAGVPVIMTEEIGDYSDLAIEKKVGCVLPHSEIDEGFFSQTTLEEILGFLEEIENKRDEYADLCSQVAYTNLHWTPVSQMWVNSMSETIGSKSSGKMEPITT